MSVLHKDRLAQTLVRHGLLPSPTSLLTTPHAHREMAAGAPSTQHHIISVDNQIKVANIIKLLKGTSNPIKKHTY